MLLDENEETMRCFDENHCSCYLHKNFEGKLLCCDCEAEGSENCDCEPAGYCHFCSGPYDEVNEQYSREFVFCSTRCRDEYEASR